MMWAKMLLSCIDQQKEENMTKTKSSIERQTYSVAETAKIFGIGLNEAYNAVARGELPHIRVGKTILLPKAKIDRMLGLIEAA